jgi:hypothetical protein
MSHFFGIPDDGKSPEKFCEFCAVIMLQDVGFAMGAFYIYPSSASEWLLIVPSFEPTVEIHVSVHLSTF